MQATDRLRSLWVQKNVRTWAAGIAVLTACSWVRCLATGSPKVDENYPSLPVGIAVFTGLVVGWGLLVAGWWGLLEAPLSTRDARKLAYMGLIATAPMLPMLSNDVYSLLMYGSLAARGRDVYTTAEWLPESAFYGWVGKHWAEKVCVYGPTTLVSTLPAVIGPWGVWGAVYALRLTWLVFLVVTMEFSFRKLSDRPLFHAFVWCNPLFMVEGAGQLHADFLGMAAVAAGIALASERRPLGGSVLYVLAVLGKYTFVFAGPFFWLAGTRTWQGRALRLLALAALLLSIGIVFYAPFWHGLATVLEPVRALASMNPGGSLVEIAGHVVHVMRGGPVPPATLSPEVAIEVERAAKAPTWQVVSFVLRLLFVAVAARQLYLMLRRRRDDAFELEALAMGAGAIVVAAITLFSHRFQSWYLMAALPFFGLRCDGAWRRWWLLAIGFSVATEFIHVLPRSAALLPVWSVLTNGAVAVVFLLWFRERFLQPPPAPETEPPQAAAAR